MMSLTASVKTSTFVTDRRWLFLKKAMQRRVFPKREAMLMKKSIPTSATAITVVRFANVIGICTGVKFVSIVSREVDLFVNSEDSFLARI